MCAVPSRPMSMLVAVLSLSTIIKWIRSAMVSGKPA